MQCGCISGFQSLRGKFESCRVQQGCDPDLLVEPKIVGLEAFGFLQDLAKFEDHLIVAVHARLLLEVEQGAGERWIVSMLQAQMHSRVVVLMTAIST